MAEIIVVNRKTISRRLWQLGIIGAVGASIYFGYPLIQNLPGGYKDWKARRTIENAIEEYHYSKALQIFGDAKGRLNDAEIDRYQKSIDEIHPYKLAKTASNLIKEYPKKIEMLKAALENIGFIPQTEQESVCYQYRSACLEDLADYLKSPDKPDIETVIQKIDSLKNDIFIGPVPESFIFFKEDTQVKSLIDSFSKYILSFGDPSQIPYRQPSQMADDFLQLIKKVSPSESKNAIEKTLEAHEGLINKIVVDDSYATDNKIKRLLYLIDLQERYNISTANTNKIVVGLLKKQDSLE